MFILKFCAHTVSHKSWSLSWSPPIIEDSKLLVTNGSLTSKQHLSVGLI